MLEKQSIPSFENLTADMQRIRISEFFNPRADCDPIVGGTTVNVRAEQEKIFVRKLDQKVKGSGYFKSFNTLFVLEYPLESYGRPAWTEQGLYYGRCEGLRKRDNT